MAQTQTLLLAFAVALGLGAGARADDSCAHAHDGVCNDPAKGGYGLACAPATDDADCATAPSGITASVPGPEDDPAGAANDAPPDADALGDHAPTPPGLNPFHVGSGPGDAMPLGRWELNADSTDAPIGHLSIEPNGTWTLEIDGVPTRGFWYDLGSNVVRLVDFDGPEDATVSAEDSLLDIRQELGLLQHGHRR